MSYSTWHNYGYGVCVDDIGTQDMARLQALLELAPRLKTKIDGWLSEQEIEEPSWDNYMEFDQDFYLGLATILKEVIAEAEGIDLTACDDYEGKAYLLYSDGIDRTEGLAKLVYLKQLCVECESRTCQFNHGGECRFAMVHERKPRINDSDGCIDYDYQEGEE